MCLPPEARAARAEQATHFNDCRVICSYIDAATGERCEASGTIDPQLEYRLHGVLYGLSVTWDAQYRTGEYVRQPGPAWADCRAGWRDRG